MTLDELIAEGRALERPCWFLSADGQGKRVGVWHGSSIGETRRWLTVDAAFYEDIAGRYVSVISDSAGSGVVELLDRLPELSSEDVELSARKMSVLPPIDAIFALGSEKVGSWLAENRWERDWGYNPNFSGSELVQRYERAYQAEHPLYVPYDVFAAIGGWHFPFPDDDWRDFIGEELLLTTFKGAEPWVEAWRIRDRSFQVIERIT